MRQVNWIVMPIWDCLALTRDAIESCLEQDIGNVRILCPIDRGLDGVAHYLRSLHPQVQTIEMPGCGVSKAWNVALSHLFGITGVDYALVANSDTRLRPDAYRRLVSDGGLFVTCVGTSSGAKFPGAEPSDVKRPHPDYSMYLIRKECWQRVGPFDASMRIFCSDGDHHLRMHRAGIDAYCLDLPFYHVASGTLKNAEVEDRERILQQAQQDRGTFRSKWGFEMGSDAYYKQFGTGGPNAAS
jgi:hypothetical protein